MVASGTAERIFALGLQLFLYLNPHTASDDRNVFPNGKDPTGCFIEPSRPIPMVFICFVVADKSMFSRKGFFFGVNGIVLFL